MFYSSTAFQDSEFYTIIINTLWIYILIYIKYEIYCLKTLKRLLRYSNTNLTDCEREGRICKKT